MFDGSVSDDCKVSWSTEEENDEDAEDDDEIEECDQALGASLEAEEDISTRGSSAAARK